MLQAHVVNSGQLHRYTTMNLYGTRGTSQENSLEAKAKAVSNSHRPGYPSKEIPSSLKPKQNSHHPGYPSKEIPRVESQRSEQHAPLTEFRGMPLSERRHHTRIQRRGPPKIPVEWARLPQPPIHPFPWDEETGQDIKPVEMSAKQELQWVDHTYNNPRQWTGHR